MASSEVLAIERLALDDVAGGLALSDAAGWNQSADDWAFFIAQGETFGMRDDTGRIVATAAALPYEGASAGSRWSWSTSPTVIAASHRP